ncbi:S8 family peptidase [Aureispira anguillae]|uniref:S8 family peptidase n=1 Tax=Aureispira anguillae TaxID=2864201 RepID=A0A915YDE6_9BACT|nr:S8 family peptidase [Aureispira anguillae]BDS11014.1 S8 family peptidase [Aureispira anguillae]
MSKYISTLFIIVLAFFFNTKLEAQRKYDIYWVSFKDKKNSPYSIFHPQEYLSARAIERRQRFNIPIDTTDLPVNPKYLEPILIKGFKVHATSRWLNGVAIITEAASSNPEDLKSFDFVKAVFPIGFKREIQKAATAIGPRDYKQNYRMKDHYYGTGKNQINMLKGQYLHKMGYEGQEMHVAIMDGGFADMRETPAFDSLFANDQILGTHDFVEGDDYVFESSSHGRNVASCMAANLPYLFVGTAPKAKYYLFKTEDMKGEYWIEEYNWVAAIERADQLGVDLVNSSLGYYDFDDNNMDYGYVDIDGKTSAMTKAAKFAAKKGMLVVTSAGNAGNDKWKHITVPGDADSILTVGAVDRDGYHAKFSSYGFENRHIIKPNVVARGAIAVVAARKRYDTSYSNGTSFSSPIMAGMVTSFWQAFPERNNMEIIQTLQNNGNYIDKPDNAYGYGIPNFLEAYKDLRNSIIELNTTQKYYHHFTDLEQNVDIFMAKVKAYKAKVELYNTTGELLYQAETTFKTKSDKRLWYQTIPNWENFPNGVYFLSIQLDDSTKYLLLTK